MDRTEALRAKTRLSSFPAFLKGKRDVIKRIHVVKRIKCAYLGFRVFFSKT